MKKLNQCYGCLWSFGTHLELAYLKRCLTKGLNAASLHSLDLYGAHNGKHWSLGSYLTCAYANCLLSFMDHWISLVMPKPRHRAKAPQWDMWQCLRAITNIQIVGHFSSVVRAVEYQTFLLVPRTFLESFPERSQTQQISLEEH